MSCAILGHGLCSPLGPADIAAPALHGGLSLAQPLAWAPEVGAGEDASPAVGHCAAGAGPATAGERWALLAALAWEELRRGCPVEGCDALLLALPLPEPLRWGPGADAWDRQVETLRASLPALPPRIERIPLGHAAPAEALARAADRIIAGAWRRVLVLAVDILIDPSSLAWLAGDDRLRGPGLPLGLAPGEAAAWWLLGAEDGTAAVGRLLRAAHIAGDGQRAPLDDADRWYRAALAAGVDGLVSRRDWVDLTGESWRDRAWGSLAPRLRDHGRPVLPARGWGDLGAAAMLAAGSAALAGSDGRPEVLWSLGEDGSAGVAVIAGLSRGHGR